MNGETDPARHGSESANTERWPSYVGEGNWRWSGRTAVIGGTECDGFIASDKTDSLDPYERGHYPDLELDLLCTSDVDVAPTIAANAARAWADGSIHVDPVSPPSRLDSDTSGRWTLVVPGEKITHKLVVDALLRFARAAGVPDELLWTCRVEIELAAPPRPVDPNDAERL